MFDEPIRIGMIRFADAYDHWAWPSEWHTNSASKLASKSTLHSSKPVQSVHLEQVAKFDSSHQPLLVIYTKRRHETGGHQ